MAHGYLGEGYGIDRQIDPDTGEGRQRREREQNRQSGGREERNRFILGDDGDRRSGDDRWLARGQNRYGRNDEARWPHDRWPEQRGRASDYNRDADRDEQSRNYSAHPDDHYRSWRDRQLQALDRDYEDYCREREQQFHRDFDEWRRNRQNSRKQSDQANAGREEELVLANESTSTSAGMTTDPYEEPQATTDAESAATLGTNNSANTSRGRR